MYDNNNYTRFEDIDFKSEIEPWINKRTEILTSFVHSKTGDLLADKDNWKEDKYWVTSIPHVQFAGECHTYNPPFESEPGWKHGIRWVLMFSVAFVHDTLLNV